MRNCPLHFLTPSPVYLVPNLLPHLSAISLSSVPLSPFLFCLFVRSVLQIPHIREIVRCLSLCLTYFAHVTSPRSIRAVASGRIRSFFRPSKTPWDTRTLLFLIRSSADRRLSRFRISATVDSAAVNIGVQIGLQTSLFSSDK